MGDVLGDGTVLYLHCGDGYKNLQPVYYDKTALKHTHTHTQMTACETSEI